MFKNLPNVFGIDDDILVVGYDKGGKGHDDTLQRVLQVSRQVNLKLNKDKCHFKCTQVLFLGKTISRNAVKPNAQKHKAMIEIPPPQKNKKELQAFFRIINYLRKYSLSTDTYWKH